MQVELREICARCEWWGIMIGLIDLPEVNCTKKEIGEIGYRRKWRFLWKIIIGFSTLTAWRVPSCYKRNDDGRNQIACNANEILKFASNQQVISGVTKNFPPVSTRDKFPWFKRLSESEKLFRLSKIPYRNRSNFIYVMVELVLDRYDSFDIFTSELSTTTRRFSSGSAPWEIKIPSFAITNFFFF